MKNKTFSVQVDSKGYAEKPTGIEIGTIKTRTQKSEPQNLTVEQIAKLLESGHTISLGILNGGLGANNWVQQQLFGVDIDNENENAPIITPKEAVTKCKSIGLHPAIVYHTSSSSEQKAKFRLIFAMDELIKEEAKRKLIAETLVNLFSQADKSCVNADRIFFGTNKPVKYSDKTICFDKILDISSYDESENRKPAMTELDRLKEEYDFENLLDNECGEVIRNTSKYKMYKHCSICGHKGDLVYYSDSKKFKCFGAHGGASGSVIDYIMHTKKLKKHEAIEYFKHELCGLPKPNHKVRQSISFISSFDLSKTKLPAINWCVKGLLGQGLAIVAAQPKSGKSWLCLSLALSVATGEDFLGYSTNRGEVLYLALEDSPQRLQKRLAKVIEDKEAPKNFNISTKVKPIKDGFFEAVEDYLQQNPDTKLVIIDTLQKIRSGGTKNESAYASDYRELGLIKEFADRNNIAILVVHHLRKQKDNDVFNKISGTNGIMGVADTVLVLEKHKKDSDSAILHITGRDVELDELLLTFNTINCQWVCHGNAEIQRRKEVEREYSDSSIAKAFREFIKLEPYGWSGTSQELLNYLNQHCQYGSEENAASFAKHLNKITDLLWSVDGIVHGAPPANGSAGKRIHKISLSKGDVFLDIENLVGEDKTTDTTDTPDTN